VARQYADLYIDRVYPAMRGAGMDSQDFGNKNTMKKRDDRSAIIQSVSLAFLCGFAPLRETFSVQVL